MADLRLVVLGCLMLVAFAQAQSEDVLKACLFTPDCPVSSIADVKGPLAKDLKRVRSSELARSLGDLIRCVSTIEMTGDGTGCNDDNMVENSECVVACDVVKKLLA